MKLFWILILAFSFTTANSQSQRVPNANELVRECSKNSENADGKQLTIWFPYNFWEIIGEQMKTSPEFTEKIVTQMKDYMMFCVVDYSTGTDGLIFKSDKEIRQTITLIDSSKNVFKPLKDEEISMDANRLIQTLQPMMAQMLGQFGEGMNIYLFKNKIINGKPTINIQTQNNFTLSWNNTRLNWKLPLSSALASKYCSVDNEKMQGNWTYCPFHGVPLNK